MGEGAYTSTLQPSVGALSVEAPPDLVRRGEWLAIERHCWQSLHGRGVGGSACLVVNLVEAVASSLWKDSASLVMGRHDASDIKR